MEVYVSLIGSTQEASFQGEGKANTAEMYVKLKPLAERTQTLFEFVDTVKRKAENKKRSTTNQSFCYP